MLFVYLVIKCLVIGCNLDKLGDRSEVNHSKVLVVITTDSLTCLIRSLTHIHLSIYLLYSDFLPAYLTFLLFCLLNPPADTAVIRQTPSTLVISSFTSNLYTSFFSPQPQPIHPKLNPTQPTTLSNQIQNASTNDFLPRSTENQKYPQRIRINPHHEREKKTPDGFLISSSVLCFDG